MNDSDYDIIIVGARCAGATLAVYLARAGARVLLLDKDRLPSDHVLSTHSINPPGVDVLDEVGVGDAMRTLAPAIRILRLECDGAAADIEMPMNRALYCPRRERLDGLLQQAAERAGAELLDGTRVVAVIEGNRRVCGVRAVRAGAERTFTARLVIGADGRRSTIARLVNASEYLTHESPRAAYWGYWHAPVAWTSDPAYAFDGYFGLIGGGARVIFQTDCGQLVIGGWPMANQQGLRADPTRALPAMLGTDPIIGPLIRDASPIGRVRGTVKERCFFRQAAGSGWALVGDAGHHKEFLLGDGITEALLQARSLAAAILLQRDAALECWWRRRDVDALGLHVFGRHLARLERSPALQRVFLERAAENPAIGATVGIALSERQPLTSAVSVTQLLGWTFGAALCGQPRVLAELMVAGWWTASFLRELRRRKRLLSQARTVDSFGGHFGGLVTAGAASPGAATYGA